MRRVISKSSKSVIARYFVFKSKCMFGGRAPPGLLKELKRFPDLIFRQQNHQKLWRPGTAWTRWGSFITPPDTLKPQWVPWKRKLSSAVRALFVEEEGVEVSGRGGDE